MLISKCLYKILLSLKFSFVSIEIFFKIGSIFNIYKFKDFKINLYICNSN